MGWALISNIKGKNGQDGQSIIGPIGPKGDGIMGPPGPPGKSIQGAIGPQGPKGDAPEHEYNDDNDKLRFKNPDGSWGEWIDLKSDKIIQRIQTSIMQQQGANASPLTTKGDVWGYSSVDARVPVGSNGQVLTADSTQALGVKWSNTGSGSPNFSYNIIAEDLEIPQYQQMIVHGTLTIMSGFTLTITGDLVLIN